MKSKLAALLGRKDEENLVSGVAIKIERVDEPHGYAVTTIRSLSTMTGVETLYVVVDPFFYQDKIVQLLQYDGRKVYVVVGSDYHEVTLSWPQ